MHEPLGVDVDLIRCHLGMKVSRHARKINFWLRSRCRRDIPDRTSRQAIPIGDFGTGESSGGFFSERTPPVTSLATGWDVCMQIQRMVAEKLRGVAVVTLGLCQKV